MKIGTDASDKSKSHGMDQQIGIEQYLALRDAQKDLNSQINLIDSKQKDLKEEQDKLYQLLDWIRNNMATKEDIKDRERSVDALESDLKSHVKETNIRLEEMSKSNQTNVINLQTSVSNSLEAFKSQVFAKFDTQAQVTGKSLTNTALLTGKFAIVYALIAMLVSSLIGGAIALFFTHAK